MKTEPGTTAGQNRHSVYYSSSSTSAAPHSWAAPCSAPLCKYVEPHRGNVQQVGGDLQRNQSYHGGGAKTITIKLFKFLIYSPQCPRFTIYSHEKCYCTLNRKIFFLLWKYAIAIQCPVHWYYADIYQMLYIVYRFIR